MSKPIKILIASHKCYPFPDTRIYYSVQVGSVSGGEAFGKLCDSSGINISDKNPFYSEMTALYWAWKNAFFKDADYCGLVHYRRYFKGEMPFEKVGILSENEITIYMRQFDILLPKKRNYWIESIQQHYCHAHYCRDFEILRRTLVATYPDYIEDFETVIRGTKLHLYNMFVMPVSLFESYMAWVFPLLFDIEKQIDVKNYDAYQRRVFGFMAERLFNVWTTHQRRVNGIKTGEIPVVNIEGENILKKGYQMMIRKYFRSS